MRLSDEVCRKARALIANRLGLDFSEGRQADLERGLVGASRTSSVSGPETYLAWLATLPDQSPEWRRLVGHLTVGETYFFRDRALFEALEEQILPSLIAARRSEGILRLRLWSAGCATGEEPYSLAIVLDRLLPDISDWTLTILATDINPAALEAAREGRYREWSFRQSPEWIRDRYFHRPDGETFELVPRIRRMVTVAPLNLAEEGYPAVVTNTSAMDLILCRNVLMYFTREAQRATTARLTRALVKEGWLVVSPAEASTDLFRPLVPVNFPGAILYRKAPVGDTPLGPAWPPEAVLPDLPPDPVLSPLAHTTGGLGTPDSPITTLPQELAKEAPPDAATDLQRARSLADQGNLEEACRQCEAALARQRLEPDAYLLLAAIRQEQGEIPAALEALRRAIYLAPHSAPAHFLLGALQFQQGKRSRGRRSMETVVSLLSSVPRDEPVVGTDGLTAGRLLETARAYLESR